MGAWGTGSFDNDAAGDFEGTLARGGLVKLRKALGRTSYDDADDCCEAVAAAECIAAARGHACKGFPADLTPLLPRWRKALKAKDVTLAQRSLAAVAKDSELAALWRESDAKGWARVLAGLGRRLKRAPAPLAVVVRPKRRKVEIGDIVEVPLEGGARAYGKVLHIATRWKGLILFGVYAGRKQSGPLVGVVKMHQNPLQLGDWPLVGHAELTRDELAPLVGKLHAVIKLDLARPGVWVAEDDETQLSMAFAIAARNHVAKLVG